MIKFYSKHQWIKVSSTWRPEQKFEETIIFDLICFWRSRPFWSTFCDTGTWNSIVGIGPWHTGISRCVRTWLPALSFRTSCSTWCTCLLNSEGGQCAGTCQLLILTAHSSSGVFLFVCLILGSQTWFTPDIHGLCWWDCLGLSILCSLPLEGGPRLDQYLTMA